MRILVIGGTGFLGSFLVPELQRSGHEVAVFHRATSGGTGPAGVTHLFGDRNALAEFALPLQRFAPEVVIDLVLSSARQAGELMRIFEGISRRVVAISSVDVYRACAVLHGAPGRLEPVPLVEDSALRTTPAYPPELVRALRGVFPWLDEEYDKVPVEREVLAHPSLPGTVLRLAMVYGLGDPLHRLHPLLKRIDDGREFIPLEERTAEWRGPRVYVENAAAAIALAATSDYTAGRIYNVAEPENFSELEWTRRVTEAAGWRGRIAVLPSGAAPAHLQPKGNPAQHWSTSSARIREELGYRETVPLDEALRRAIAWEREHPPAQIDPSQFDYAAEDAAARPQVRKESAP